MLDKILTCADCKNEFLFTSSEQTFYAAKKFTDPKRCKPCRERKRAERDAKEAAGQ